MTTTKMKLYQISQETMDIFIGTILGDASIKINNAITLATYSFAQATVRAEYLTFVINGLGSYTSDRKVYNGSTYDRRYDKTNTFVSFATLSIPDLVWIHQIFYSYNSLTGAWVKVIPADISNFLTPRALAFWIIDDGFQTKRNGVTLCTDCFSYEDVMILKTAIEKNFGFKCTLHFKNKKYYRIYISRKDLPRIIEILEKYFHPSILYKLYGKTEQK